MILSVLATTAAATTDVSMVKQCLSLSVTAFGSVFLVLAIFFIVVKFLTRNEWKDNKPTENAR